MVSSERHSLALEEKYQRRLLLKQQQQSPGPYLIRGGAALTRLNSQYLSVAT